MSPTWINLSTRWSMTSVQAALNVFISVLGTVGVWSFSRYWWQRGCTKILRNKSSIPLPVLCTVSSPGEGWDLAVLLHKRLVSKAHWQLLVQLVVIIAATVACMLAGPIAKLSLRSTKSMQPDTLQVLQTTKGEGFTNNVLDHNVLWNDTLQGLDRADFPDDQLLDYVILSDPPWTYVASEWDPTWSMKCDKFPEAEIRNVSSPGGFTMYDPLHAFPAIRATYDDFWLNETEFRVQSDFVSWIIQDGTPDPPFTDALFFVLVISNPELDGRMYTNNQSLRLSMSIYHAREFRISDYDDFTEGAATKWSPLGPVGSVSYARIECNISRSRQNVNPDLIPWPWTNNTYSITRGYANYWDQVFEDLAARSLPVSTPTPEEILRYYQVYTATANTIHSFPSWKSYSIWKDTVQLSVIFLAIFLLLAALTIWQTIRYLVFLRRYKSKLDKTFIPDGKLEWMVHTAKVSAETETEKMTNRSQVKDQEYFRAAVFGYHDPSERNPSDTDLGFPGLARVYTNRGSITGSIPKSPTRWKPIKFKVSAQNPPAIIVLEEKEKQHQPDQVPTSVDCCKDGLTVAARSMRSSSTSSRSCSPGHSQCGSDRRLPSQHTASCSVSGGRPSFDGSVQTMVHDGNTTNDYISTIEN